jgi:hypothetical protein
MSIGCIRGLTCCARRKGAIAYDLVPVDSPVRRLYECDVFTQFIALVLDKAQRHRSADCLDALERATFEDGAELG